MDGFWTIQFEGVQGWGAGVITLIKGVVFGGDSGYLYTGTYTQQGNAMTAHVHVQAYVNGIPNVMGRSSFDLEITGTEQGNSVRIVGAIPGTQLRLNGTLTKRGEIPA